MVASFEWPSRRFTAKMSTPLRIGILTPQWRETSKQKSLRKTQADSVTTAKTLTLRMATPSVVSTPLGWAQEDTELGATTKIAIPGCKATWFTAVVTPTHTGGILEGPGTPLPVTLPSTTVLGLHYATIYVKVTMQTLPTTSQTMCRGKTIKVKLHV